MYEWAINKEKLEQAIREVRGDSDLSQTIGTNEVTEDAVKAVYIRLNGLVREKVKEPEPVEEKQAKKTKKSKK